MANCEWTEIDAYWNKKIVGVCVRRVSILNGVVCICKLYMLWNWVRSTECRRNRSNLSRSPFWEVEYKWNAYIRSRKDVFVAVTLWTLISSKQFAILAGIPDILTEISLYVLVSNRIPERPWPPSVESLKLTSHDQIPDFFCRYIPSRVKTALSNSPVIFYVIHTVHILIIHISTY